MTAETVWRLYRRPRWPDDTSHSLAAHAGVYVGASAKAVSHRLMFMASPKAGATLTMRLLFGVLGLTRVAHAYGDPAQYPLAYAHEVWAKSAEGRWRKPSDASPCVDGDWLCVAFVRNPMDRAISAYIHSMRYPTVISDHFVELKHACHGTRSSADRPRCQRDASFYEFARALEARARAGSESYQDGHFMPQVVPTITPDQVESPTHRAGVLHYPIEHFNHLPDETCPLLARLKTFRARMLTTEALVLGERPLEHYIVPVHSDTPGTELWEWHRVASALEEHTLPSYDTFWTNRTFCRLVVGGLYQADLELYTRVCRQHSLRRCRGFRSVCDTQLGRLRDVCGLDLLPPPPSPPAL